MEKGQLFQARRRDAFVKGARRKEVLEEEFLDDLGAGGERELSALFNSSMAVALGATPDRSAGLCWFGCRA